MLRINRTFGSPLPGAAAASTHPGRSGGVPRWWPARWYYGWALVGTLGVSATVSYGILWYALTAFIVPMGAELGWSRTQVTGAYSLAQLIAGIAAIPVGRWVDRHGARALMTTGSALAAIVLVAWSGVHSLAAFYAVFALLGVAMAAVLYEPAFAVVAVWFQRDRSRALTVLTFLGGFASVVFVPLAAMLIAGIGWRATLLVFAGIHTALALVPHALVLRRRPSDLGLHPDGGRRAASSGLHRPAARREASVPSRLAVRSRSFVYLCIAFALSAIATTTLAVHLVPLLLERGYSLAFAGAAMGILGLMALPGRLIFTPMGDRFPRAVVTASLFVLPALGVGALLVSHATWAIWVFIALFGMGFGAITPARAALVGELYGPASYGGISGVLAFVLSLARAGAPVGASLVYSAAGGRLHGYDAVLGILLALCLGAAAAVMLAVRADGRARHSSPVVEDIDDHDQRKQSHAVAAGAELDRRRRGLQPQQ